MISLNLINIWFFSSFDQFGADSFGHEISGFFKFSFIDPLDILTLNKNFMIFYLIDIIIVLPLYLYLLNKFWFENKKNININNIVEWFLTFIFFILILLFKDYVFTDRIISLNVFLYTMVVIFLLICLKLFIIDSFNKQSYIDIWNLTKTNFQLMTFIFVTYHAIFFSSLFYLVQNQCISSIFIDWFLVTEHISIFFIYNFISKWLITIDFSNSKMIIYRSISFYLFVLIYGLIINPAIILPFFIIMLMGFLPIKRLSYLCSINKKERNYTLLCYFLQIIALFSQMIYCNLDNLLFLSNDIFLAITSLLSIIFSNMPSFLKEIFIAWDQTLNSWFGKYFLFDTISNNNDLNDNNNNDTNNNKGLITTAMQSLFGAASAGKVTRAVGAAAPAVGSSVSLPNNPPVVPVNGQSVRWEGGEPPNRDLPPEPNEKKENSSSNDKPTRYYRVSVKGHVMDQKGNIFDRNGNRVKKRMSAAQWRAAREAKASRRYWLTFGLGLTGIGVATSVALYPEQSKSFIAGADVSIKKVVTTTIPPTKLNNFSQLNEHGLYIPKEELPRNTPASPIQINSLKDLNKHGVHFPKKA